MLAPNLKYKNIFPNCDLFFSKNNLLQALVDDFCNVLSSQLSIFSTINIAVSGGSVGHSVWPLIAHSLKLYNFKSLNIYLCDERYVGLSSPDSNTKIIKKELDNADLTNCTLLTTRDPELFDSFEEWVDDYDGLISGTAPYGMDICFLGVGEDGHVASIFPMQADDPIRYYKKNDKSSILGIYNSPKPPQKRMTLSMPYLQMSRQIYIYASGESKAHAIRSICNQNLSLPCTQICAHTAQDRQKVKIFTDIEI